MNDFDGLDQIFLKKNVFFHIYLFQLEAGLDVLAESLHVLGPLLHTLDVGATYDMVGTN